MSLTRQDAIAVYEAAARIHAEHSMLATSKRTRRIKHDAKTIAVAMENYLGQLGRIPAEKWK